MKLKSTKKKYIRQLIRNYEIELQRPKGLKYLDMFIKQVPNGMNDISLFISKSIHKECNFISKYKGYEVISSFGIKHGSCYGAKKSNLYYPM